MGEFDISTLGPGGDDGVVACGDGGEDDGGVGGVGIERRGV